MESKFLASQAYGLDKSRFHFFDSTFDLVLGLASNLLGWMPWMWDVSAGLVAKAGFEGWGGDIPTSLTFVVLTMLVQVRRTLQRMNAPVEHFILRCCVPCCCLYGGGGVMTLGLCSLFPCVPFFANDANPRASFSGSLR